MLYPSNQQNQELSQKGVLLVFALLLLIGCLLVTMKAATAAVNNSKVVKANTETVTSSLSTINKVDLNTATIDELEALPYIGTKRAAAIVAFRKANGGFDSVEQLQQLSNISALTANKLEKHVFVEKNMAVETPKKSSKEHNNH